MLNDYEIRGEVTAIFLKRKGKILETLIDTEDLEKVKYFPTTWFSRWSPQTMSYYVFGNRMVKAKKQTAVQLHRFLTDCPKGMQVDHVNHDTLDNRRSTNLRNVTQSENQQNRVGPNKSGTSGFRGVSYRKDTKRWATHIRIDNKITYLGQFDDINEANKVVVEARKNLMACSYADRK